MRTIGFDADGVLYDFVGGVIDQMHREERARGLTHESCDRWDIAEAFGIEQHVLDGMCGQPGWASELVVLPGAVEAVERLRKRYRVVCVTSPYEGAPTWQHDRLAALKRDFGFAKWDVLFCSDKSLARVDALIDDKPENLFDDCGDGVFSLGCLIERPWNAEWRKTRFLSSGYQRTNDSENDLFVGSLDRAADVVDAFMFARERRF